MSTPFDIDSARFLRELGVEIFKIASGEITNYLLLREIGSYGKKVILSTGMADLGEIEDALDVLIQSGTKKEDITVLHCNTEYPTPFEDVNLKAMLTIKEAFKVNVGLFRPYSWNRSSYCSCGSWCNCYRKAFYT